MKTHFPSLSLSLHFITQELIFPFLFCYKFHKDTKKENRRKEEDDCAQTRKVREREREREMIKSARRPWTQRKQKWFFGLWEGAAVKQETLVHEKEEEQERPANLAYNDPHNKKKKEEQDGAARHNQDAQ